MKKYLLTKKNENLMNIEYFSTTTWCMSSYHLFSSIQKAEASVGMHWHNLHEYTDP